nr:hypothetical protein [Tanacetum cinerariifolium]
MDDGDSQIAKEANLFDALEHKSTLYHAKLIGKELGMRSSAKEANLFDALEHKSVVIKVDNQKIVIFTKVPLRAFGEPFMRYSIPCKVDWKGAWDAELDLADSANYVMVEVLETWILCKDRLNKKELTEKDKVGIIEHDFPKKMCDPRNYVLLVKINGVVEMVALVDTEAS